MSLFNEYQRFVYCMCQESIPRTIMLPPLACSVITTSDGSNDFSLHQEWSPSKRNLDPSYQALISHCSIVRVWCFSSHWLKACTHFVLPLFSPFEAREFSSSCLLGCHSVHSCWTGFDGWDFAWTTFFLRLGRIIYATHRSHMTYNLERYGTYKRCEEWSGDRSPGNIVTYSIIFVFS